MAVAARQPARGRALADEIGVDALAWPPPAGWDLLVNTTPVGTWPQVDEAPIDRAAVTGGTVYDLIYNPRETHAAQVGTRGGRRDDRRSGHAGGSGVSAVRVVDRP